MNAAAIEGRGPAISMSNSLTAGFDKGEFPGRALRVGQQATFGYGDAEIIAVGAAP